jgi:hypothetical protein
VEDGRWHYLRFYEDGAVISTSTLSDPSELRRWFARGTGELKIDEGHFSIERNGILFVIPIMVHGREQKRISYEGVIHGNAILLDVRDSTQKAASSRTYHFVEWDR